MNNEDFVLWLRGVTDTVDALNKTQLPYTKQIIISGDIWVKIKEEISNVGLQKDPKELIFTNPFCSDTKNPGWVVTTTNVTSGHNPNVSYKAPDWYTETSPYNPNNNNDPIL